MPPPRTRGTALRHRLAELRGPDVPAKALDARALAALAANPGCARRAILDGAGVNKAALASALGSPSAFGQSQFALTRGNAFEAKVKADGGAELLRLVHEKLDRSAEPPVEARVPDLTATGPRGRTARTELELREATAHPGAWTLLDHPMLALDVAGSPAFLEPDAVVVHPDGSWTVVEIKSFPLLDGSADPAKVGAAARQAAVYVLALEELAARLGAEPEGGTARLGAEPEGDAAPLGAEPEGGTARLGAEPEGGAARLGVEPEGGAARLGAEPEGGTAPLGEEGDARADGTGVPVPRVRHRVLLVCPRDFSNLPAASAVDIRKQRAVTARQLARLTRIEDVADALPEGTCFSPELPAEALAAAVESVPATYAPECLSACELAFHCRTRSRQEGAVTSLGRPVRAELGGLTTVEDVLAAARGEAGDPDDPAVAALRRAAALRAEALEAACR
ncbi:MULTISPECIES: hypothetical protein [Streptomyces]|uniref:hypothetical protein n=1 Tax=Streptomyces TaxID=1883 RepID=UPI000CF25E28|nr:MULTISPECIES: hypothetical protein [Streptomyces]PPS74355.1 hypothetical protein BV882_11925 [Streptomyces sp. 46]